MGMKNVTGVRKVTRGTKPRWVLDFRYTDQRGARQRYRRDASVQNHAAAVAEARRLMARAAETGSVDEPKAVPPTTTAATVATFVEQIFTPTFMPRFREGTQVRYRALLGQGLLATFGELRLVDVDGMKVRAFAAQLQGRGVQVKGAINLLRTILRSAVEAGALETFPEIPRLVKASKKLPDAPSDEEVTAMRTHATGWLQVAIALAVFGGLRQGEVRALEVRDVDLAHGRLYVRRALSENALVTPKSGHERVIPLAPELRAILENFVAGKPPRSRIVVLDDGRTPTRQGLLRVFKAFQKRHGLKERSFHSLRHYFCTTLIRRGASVEAVRVLAGHTNLQVTQRYVHAAAADLEAAIAKLSA